MIRIPRNRWVTVLVIVIAVVGISAWFFTPASAGEDNAVIARVKQGDFHVVVTSAGELRAKKFVQVQGPLNMQQAEVYQTKISSLVPEGTVVSGLESDGADLFFCGGGKSGKIRAVKRPRRRAPP